MTPQFKGQHFLKLLDLTQEEIQYLVDLAADLKAEKLAGAEVHRLKGKNIALIFEKGSTRTRCAFEVAAADQGASSTYLGPTGSHLGKKESVKDTARVLGRMYDGIEYRGHGQAIVEELAAHAGVPVFNGLTDEFHPTQMLADLLTMQELSDTPLKDVSFAYLGDARSNMGHSLMIAGCMMGMDVRVAAPKDLWPSDTYYDAAMEQAKKYGATLTLTDDPVEAVKDVDYIHTDVWVSMGEDESVWAERIKALLPYQVNSDLMAASGKASTKFMHCLPAHRGEEVSAEVIDGPASVVFDQAENRLHAQKAVMRWCLGS